MPVRAPRPTALGQPGLFKLAVHPNFRDPNGGVIELCAIRTDLDAMMDPASNGARAAPQRWRAAMTWATA